MSQKFDSFNLFNVILHSCRSSTPFKLSVNVTIRNGKPAHSLAASTTIHSTYGESGLSCPSFSVNKVQDSLSERVSTLILFRIFICQQTISDRVVIMSLDHFNGIGIPTSCGSKEFHKSSKMRIHFCFFTSSFASLTALDRSSYLLERSK